MKKDVNQLTFEELKALIQQFIDDRDWQKYHNPKNLSMSISIESAELMEIFQWLTIDESIALKDNRAKFEHIKEEIADIVIYCLSLCNVLDIDLNQAIVEKIEKNRSKYPTSKYKGNFE
ncbi:MAG: nucleotide pyrophosphohydrolase [bacterium]|nr:nucleotide pyrophosphohydrolase [bacterium]